MSVFLKQHNYYREKAMYKEQIHFNRPPFQDTIDTAFFFSGGMRREVVDEIKSALTDTIPLLTLTGDEGSGKTMVCRMVEKELPVGFASVFIPRTVESFDDVVRIVAQETVVRQEDDEEDPGTRTLLQEIVRTLKESGQRLLIVFDESEKIYLATLERIRKMLDQVNEEGVVFQILLSGNSLLEQNLEQLGIVAFEEIEERHFALKALDSEATWMYLNYCIRVASGEKRELFSRDIVGGIFTIAAGNFRKINHLAQETLQSEKLDTSFLVLLDNINDKPVSKKNKEIPSRRSRASTGMPEVNLNFLKFPVIKLEWLLYGGGACAIALLVFLLLGRSGNEDSSQDTEISNVPIIELKAIEPLDSKASPENSKKPPVFVAEKNNKQPVVVVKTPPVALEPKAEKVAGQPEETASKKVVGGKPPEPVVIEPQEPRETVSAMVVDSGVEDIYMKRLTAGTRWLVGGGEGEYTVQLMVLTSEQAEENLKKMLDDADYRAVADQLFILRRVGLMSTVMVFYGEYPTLPEARNARNNLPIFLRKHHPYAISIRGAVEKTKATQ